MAFEEHSRRGRRAKVLVALPDGSVSEGVDSAIGGSPGRLREDRDRYRAISVGNRACVAEGRDAPWTCSDLTIDYGIPAVAWEAVTRVVRENRDCDGQTCVHLRIDAAAVLSKPGSKKTAIAMYPELYGSTLELDLRLPDYLPIRQILSERRGDLGETKSESEFEYDVDVGPIELPDGESAGR